VETHRKIGEARALFVAAICNGDAVAAGVAYTEDARLFAPSTELIEGRSSIERFWRTGIGVGVSSAELEPLALKHACGLAYEVGRYALHLEAEGDGEPVDRGTYLVVHERQPDGRWRRAAEMFHADAAPCAQRDRRTP